MTRLPIPVLIRLMWPQIGFLVLFAALVASWFLDAPTFVSLALALAMGMVLPVGQFWRERSSLGWPRAAASVAGSQLRGVLLLWLAITVSLTVLVAIGGFQRDDRILVVAIWAILGVLWLGERGVSRVRGTG